MTIRLIDNVWCRTCAVQHIATIPVVTFRCYGAWWNDVGCGYGGWWVDEAGRHATDYPDHIVHPQHHETVPLEGAP